MKKYLFFIGAIAISFAACSDANSTITANTNDTLNSIAQADQTNNLEASTSGATQPNAGSIAQDANKTNASGALNPKHGEPGHRCDIPEGAPLNSAPATPQAAPQAAPQQAQPQIQMQQNTPAPQTTAPGFSGKPNPEHGKPGHRCDLEVGAILP